MNDIFQKQKELNKRIYFDDGVIVIDVISNYEILIERCNTKEKILDWVLHLSEKSWMDRGLIRQFIQVAYSANELEMKPI